LVICSLQGASAAQGDLLVSGRLDNKVNLFAASNGAFLSIAAQTGLSNPVGVAVGLDGNLYVANGLTNQVLRFSSQTGAPLGVFASGGGLSGPRDLCFGPDGHLYVASGVTHQVLRYNGLTGAFIGIFAQGGGLNGPVAVRFGPDGNLYVAGGNSNAIYAFNGVTGAFIKTFATGSGLSNPAYIDFGPNRDLYVANFNTNQVLRFNGVTGVLKSPFASASLTQPVPIKFGPDGNLYVGSADQDKVYKYNGTTGALLGSTALGSGLDNPNGIAFVPSAASTPASFGLIGDLTGGVLESHALAVSADGLTVAGQSVGTSGPQAVRWQSGLGLTGLGDLAGGAFGSAARGVNFDGTVIVGDSDSANGLEAFRWTSGGGIVGMSDLAGGIFESSASSTNGDGSNIFGFGNDGTGKVAFRWTLGGGIVAIGDLTGGAISAEVWRTSADGSVFVGQGTSGNGPEAFRWTQTSGFVGLGDVAGGSFSSAAYGVSANGTFSVGEVTTAAGTEASVWTNTGAPLALSDLAGGQHLSRAHAVSDNGRVVVGRGSSLENVTGAEAFIWISGQGLFSLRNFLTTQGATGLSGISLTVANDISPDGGTIVGDSLDSVGTTIGFIARIKPVPITVSFPTSPAYRGSSSNEGAVFMSSPAGPGGMLVNLTSSNSSVASVPATVLIPEGMARTRFFITAPNTALTPMTATITATCNGFSKAAVLSVVTPRDLFVSSSGTNSVKRYNGVTGAYIGNFVAPASGGLNNPQGLTFGPDGHLYVSSVSSGRVLKYDGTTAAFLGAFTQGPLMTFPADMDWRSGFLYVSDFGVSGVHKYDATTGAYIGLFNTSPVPSPDGLSWDASGNLYVSSFQNFIRKFSPTGVLIGDFVPLNGIARPLDSRFGTDGHLYVNSYSTGTVKKFNGVTGAFMSDFITGLGQTQGQAIGPDGKLYVGSYNGNFIKKYDATTGADLGTFASGGGLLRPNNFAFAPLPPLFASFTANPNPIPGGLACTGTITLNIVAAAGGQVVTLSSNNAAVVVPASVTIPAGSSTVNFNIAATNTGYGKFSATITATTSGTSKGLSVTVAPTNFATFVGQTVPTTMVSGQTYPVTIQFNNVGPRTWDTAHGYKLQSKNANDNTNFGSNRIPMTNSPVATGQTANFSANMIAPPTSGTYNFQWRPIQDDIAINFGPNTPAVSVTVTKLADAARWISRTGALTVNAGQDFFVQNTMMNVGTNTWSHGSGYSMTTLNPTGNTVWGNSRAYMNPALAVAPNANGLFTGSCTAPLTPGTYQMQWQMNKGAALFGDKSPLLTISVIQGANNAQFVSQTGVPTTVASNATFSATITMKNLGSATWGAGYSLVPVGTNTWGQPSIASPTVVPNADGTFNATFTAPGTPGAYTFQWRMQEGSTKFGGKSSSVTITVT
jgi:hypothetical protein